MTLENTDGYLNKAHWKQIFVDHILADILWAIESKRELVAAQLIFSAIDIVAGIERPKEQENTSSNNYIAWCDAYMALKGREYRLTGQDLWGARCGFLHGYTAKSTAVLTGKARMLSYLDVAKEDILTDNREGSLVLVSIRALYKALCAGFLASMKRVNSDKQLADLVNERLNMMFYSVPLEEKYNVV